MSEVSSPSQMFPSPDELFTRPALGQRLRQQLYQRYAEHGGEYLTERQHVDGRTVNACMDKNSAQDAIEEVTDTIFNIAVLQFKGYHVGHLMTQAQQLWNDLTTLKEFIDNETENESYDRLLRGGR